VGGGGGYFITEIGRGLNIFGNVGAFLYIYVMKLKESVKKVSFPIYYYTIFIVKTNDIVGSRIKRDNVLGSFKVKREDKYVGGMHSSKDGEPNSYLFINAPDANGIVHECYHAVSRMFCYIGAEFEEEVFAYTLGYLVEKVTDFIKK
jgi:hypothetical protein